MQFRLLGPLEVEEDGRLLVLGSAKQRALLAILSLRANEVVSRDRLIDELWGERPPASALHSLDVYVSRLRKTLQANGGERLLVTRAGGYLLRLEPEQLDLTCFERLLEEGRRALAAGNYGRASERLSEALALWRGPALADLAYEPFAAAEVERLEEQRLAALEERLEAELALGRHASLIGELEALSGKHPLRERLHGQLMLALYRCGRQAEALEVYRETRRHLLDEVGIDPSPALQRLEQAILRQDPALELPAQPSSDDGRPPPVEPMAPSRGRPPIEQWRPALLALGVAGLIVAAVAAAIVFFTGSSGPSLSGVDANAVGIVDPKTGRITGEVQLDGTPTQVAAGAGSIWAVSPNRQSVSRIDSTPTQLVQTIPVGPGASGIAYGGGAVWVANSLDGTVSRIDPGTNRVVEKIPVGNLPIAVAAGFDSIWVTSSGDRAVVRLDARSGRRLVITTGDVGRGIAVGDGAVWVSDYDRGRVSRIDPRSNEVTRKIPVGNGPAALTYAAGALWVANELDGTVTRIDPQQNVVTGTVSIGGTPGDLAFADGGLWVSDRSGGRIVRVDREGTEVVASIETGNRPQGVALAAGRLWLTVGAAVAKHRGGTLRLVSTKDEHGYTFDSLDPGLGYDGAAWNVLTMLYDGLTAFQRVGNADATKIVPDLAVSLPTPSDDGRTYIFQLRPGIHYSNGQLVRPRDFRYGLERVFALHPSPSNRIRFYDSLRGAARCVRQPKRCDLSEGVVTDERTKTVAFHLVTPDPEFLQKLAFHFAAPVPVATPKRETIVPATGPYHIARYARGRRLELRRNPHFREWSKAATPDGYADRISWTFLPHAAGSDQKKEVREVEQGRADVAFDGVPRELLHEVNTQYATQVHARPLWGVTYLFLNTRVPPFNDLRVRLAANYAANRSAAVPASAQNLGGKPTCQILPPNFPGYRRYCPYTLHPGPSGVWKRPDLKRARRLVAASGTKGAPVTIWIPYTEASEGPIARALMRSLGYRTRLKRVNPFVFCCSARGLGNPRSRVQAGVGSWFADYPGASSFIEFFSCTGFAHFCDGRVESLIQRALRLPTTDPYGANQLWGRIDHAMVDRAAVVPLITHKSVDFVSKRVGNYQSNPYPIGVLLDQLWVR
jgi:YVTN family beta-propeller protein